MQGFPKSEVHRLESCGGIRSPPRQKYLEGDNAILGLVDWKGMLSKGGFLHPWSLCNGPCDYYIEYGSNWNDHICFDFVGQMFKSLEEKKGLKFITGIGDDGRGNLTGSLYKHSFEDPRTHDNTGKKIKIKIKVKAL